MLIKKLLALLYKLFLEKCWVCVCIYLYARLCGVLKLFYFYDKKHILHYSNYILLELFLYNV